MTSDTARAMRRGAGAAAGGYLLGSISFARLVVRWRTGGPVAPIDLSTPDGRGHLRSRAVSASAVRLQLGPRYGLLVGALDILKAFVPTVALRLAAPEQRYFLICAASAPFGHNWPVWHRFRGGNGQAVILGGMLAIDPVGAVVTNGAATLLGLTVLRDGLIGDIGGIPLLVPWLWWRTHGDPGHLGYAVAVNAAWWVSFWPSLVQYARLKRHGHLPTAEHAVAMFRMDFGFVRRMSRRRYAEVDAARADAAAGGRWAGGRWAGGRRAPERRPDRGPGQGPVRVRPRRVEPAPADRRLIGGKAAHLQAARAAGLPVPAFRALTIGEVAALADGGPGSGEARARLDGAMRELGGQRVAVRSSAQAEDGARSFAGQFLTRLDVAGDQVLDAIREVAASGGSARVRSYSAATGVDAGGVAVIVQVMVPARWSGVAFSRDPLTYQPDVLVEAVAGPGEELVAGRRTPTRAWFARPALTRSSAERHDPVPDEVLSQAAALALRCEDVLGGPQDVEWVHDGAGIHLLQSRGLTGFEAAELFSDTWSAEVWPGLIKPLVFDVGDIAVNAAWGRILTSVAGPLDIDWRRMAGLAASRVYFNETLLSAVLARAGLPENTLDAVVRGARPRMREASVPRLLTSTGRLGRFLLGNARWLRRARAELPVLAERTDALTRRASAADAAGLADLLDPLLDLLSEAAHLSALTTMSMGLRAGYARVAVRALRHDGDVGAAATSDAGAAPLAALGRLSARVGRLSEEQRAAIAEGDHAGIVAALGADEAGRAALAEMEGLLGRWGHVAAVNTDFSTPTWREDPAVLWRLLLATGATRAPAATGGARPGGAGRWGPRAAVVERRLAVLREFVSARDEVNDLLARAYDAWRVAARAAGSHLSPQVLPDPALVHYLRLAELERALRGSPDPGLAESALARRDELERDAELAPPHRLWDLRLPEPARMTPGARARDAMAGQMLGVPASPGRVQGTARVLASPAQADRLGPGEILVVDHADIGWSPLFPVAGGVVTSVGGALSHAAVVARELGIPAVVGLPDAHHRIGDGSLIRLDGGHGSVEVVDAGTIPAGGRDR